MRVTEQQIDEAFTVIGVPRAATLAQVKASYRELIRVWHPDKFGGDAKLASRAESETKKINAAYTTLETALNQGWRPTSSAPRPASQTTESRTQTSPNPVSNSGEKSRSTDSTPSPAKQEATLSGRSNAGRWGAFALMIAVGVCSRSFQKSAETPRYQEPPSTTDAAPAPIAPPLELPKVEAISSWSTQNDFFLEATYDTPFPLNVQVLDSVGPEGAMLVRLAHSSINTIPYFAVQVSHFLHRADAIGSRQRRAHDVAVHFISQFKACKERSTEHVIGSATFVAHEVLCDVPWGKRYVRAIVSEQTAWGIILDGTTDKMIIEQLRLVLSFRPRIATETPITKSSLPPSPNPAIAPNYLPKKSNRRKPHQPNFLYPASGLSEEPELQ